MNKKNLFEQLTLEIKKNLELAIAAAQHTYDAATHEDAKAENKYDTRGLEASYLAGAQAERVNDLRETLKVISSMAVRDFSNESKIALTALVEIASEEKNNWVLLLPMGGGQSVNFEQKQIQVVTPASPLGQKLVGRSIGDEIIVNQRSYEILQVL